MKHKDFRYDKAAKDLKKLLLQLAQVEIKKNSKIDYKGVDIESSSILATSNNIKSSFTEEQIALDKERGRDVIDTFINKVFQLGYSVGYEKSEEDNKIFREIVEKIPTSLSDK